VGVQVKSGTPNGSSKNVLLLFNLQFICDGSSKAQGLSVGLGSVYNDVMEAHVHSE
jgi:hypothetical protein